MKVRDVIGAGARVTTRSEADFRPDITIVTPTFRRNAEGLLRACLASAREQTCTSYEHIIIDDGSSDGTEALVLELCEQDERVVYVRHDENSGLPAVRTNEGILRARGKAVAFLFDDNIFEPHFLADAWSLLEQSSADLVHGRVDVPTGHGPEIVFGAWPLSLDLIRVTNTIANGGVLARRDFFDRFGLYDPHITARRVCDWELWLRALWLGARFRHLPRVVAKEKGHISPTSLGNSVSVDWKVLLPYLQDETAYADRARRFAPSAILDADVLDARRIAPYLRNANEWRELAACTYAPYLRGRPIDFDPMQVSNRMESIDPSAGWNPPWALHQRRFRAHLLANSVPGLGSLIVDALRTIPGAIVSIGPEWSFPTLEPGSLDVIVCLDCASPEIGSHIERQGVAGARVLYVTAYGEQPARESPAFEAPAWSSSPHIRHDLTRLLYLPQAGHRHPPELVVHARRLSERADIIVDAGAGARHLTLPSLLVPPLSTCGRRHARTIAYRLRDAADSAEETIVRCPRHGDDCEPSAGESLASLILARRGTEIRVEKADLDALPRAEIISIASLAASRDVDIVAHDGARLTEASAGERAGTASDWKNWLANLVRLVRLRHRLGLAAHQSLTIDIYLNSELFAGSEVYGLRMAKLLADLGIRVRVRIPERNIYGEPTAINAWLTDHGLPAAVRAPYLPSVLHSAARPVEDRAPAVARLHAFVQADRPDLILACCHLPQLVEMPERPPLFMAFFSAAAYQQTWLRDLHGQVHGVLSDSTWALRPTKLVIGAPSRVIPSPVIGAGGGEIARIAESAGRRPVRVAIAGTVMPRKGQLGAVKAISVLRRRGYDVELHLYGFELEVMNAYVDLVDATIAGEGLAGCVFRHGFVEDGSEITRNNDIVLCASTDESLPQGLVFQMFQGLIGVSVLCGGVDEMIIDGKTGYLTQDPTPAGIADAIARAVDDRTSWRAVAEAARQHIRERCGQGVVAASLLDLFEEGLALWRTDARQSDARSRAAMPAKAAREETASRNRNAVSSCVEPAAAKLRGMLQRATERGPPRIAYFCHSPHLGGAENVLLKVAQSAARSGFESVLVLPKAWGDHRAEIHRYAEQSGIAVHQLPLHAETEFNAARQPDRAAVEEIAHWLRANGIALVHSVTLMREVGEATRLIGLPHVASLFATRSVAHARIDHCDAIHSDTWLYAKRWADVLGAPAQRILSAVPDVYFEVAAERPIAARIEAIRQRRPVIAILGTVQPRKGQLKAIEAIGKLRRAHGLHLRLNVYGYTNFFPDYVAACHAAITSQGIEDLVDIRGFVEDGARHALREADVVMCSSDWESLPQSILEGMAAGALIISPRIGGVAEILNEDSAVLVSENSPDAVAGGILSALSSEPDALRAKMQNARSKAMAGCASDVVAASMFQLYAQAVLAQTTKRSGSNAQSSARGKVDAGSSVAAIVQQPAATRERSPVNRNPQSERTDSRAALQWRHARLGKSRICFFIKPSGAHLAGVELLAKEGIRIHGALASAGRRDIPLRRAEGEVDASGIVRLLWSSLETNPDQPLVLSLQIQRTGRQGFLDRFRHSRIGLQNILYDSPRLGAGNDAQHPFANRAWPQ